MGEINLDFDLLAEDNIRTLKVPSLSFKKPICIILVGIPSSGKTFLTKKLAETFPLAVLSEEDTMAFMSPRATIFRRNTFEIFQLAAKTIEHLIKQGKSCIYDANMKTREQRELLRTIVEQSGGSILVIHIDCPKDLCYKRLKKHNLYVTRGEAKGFILDKDYFEYEVVSTHAPSSEEHHLTFDCQNVDDLGQIAGVIQRRLSESN